MIYIDSAYPASDSIIETQQRTNQMNNILRVISDLQMSCTYGQFIYFQLVSLNIKSWNMWGDIRLIYMCVYIHAHVWPSTSSQTTSWPSRMCRSTWCLFATSRSFKSLWKMTISSKWGAGGLKGKMRRDFTCSGAPSNDMMTLAGCVAPAAAQSEGDPLARPMI